MGKVEELGGKLRNWEDFGRTFGVLLLFPGEDFWRTFRLLLEFFCGSLGRTLGGLLENVVCRWKNITTSDFLLTHSIGNQPMGTAKSGLRVIAPRGHR